MTDMATAHRLDYAAHALMDKTIQAIEALLTSGDAIGRLHLEDREALLEVKRTLQKRAAQIVRVWD